MRRWKNERLRIIVLGYIVRGPLGGLAWHHLQYVLGLCQLGHEVYFVEDSDDYPSCYDPSRGFKDVDPSYGIAFAEEAFARLGLGRRWSYFDAHTGRWLGPIAAKVLALIGAADLLLNLSGINPIRPWLERIPVRVFVDTDPVFTQIRHIDHWEAREYAKKHNAFFTFGEEVGAPNCLIPDDGFRWRVTRQPVVLDVWAVTPGPNDGRFTTVMQWDSYSTREHRGRHFGMKSESFGPYMDLPQRTSIELEIALGSSTAPRHELERLGWRLRDSLEITRDPWSYQEYIRLSSGEFGMAKHGYVVSNSGWFSERSACYLASGRPVIVQETGFSAHIPSGTGLVSFCTPDEALTGLEEVRSRYGQHCKAARALAESHFEATGVLSSLIERAFNA